MRQVRLAIGGASLEAAWWGDAAAGGPTIVMLHEGLGCVALWRQFPARLPQAVGGRAFAWSRAGYGGSPPVPPPWGTGYMHAAAGDVARVLDTIGVSACLLLGHSDGASIAALYAGTHDDPRVRGLVLIAPHLMVEDETIAGIEEARDRYLHGDLRQRLARYHADVDSTFWGWNGAWLDPAFRAWDITAEAANIRVPVLAIQGLADPYGTAAQVAALRAPDVRPLLLPNVGHSPHLEAPEPVLAAIGGFAKEVMAPGVHSALS